MFIKQDKFIQHLMIHDRLASYAFSYYAADFCFVSTDVAAAGS